MPLKGARSLIHFLFVSERAHEQSSRRPAGCGSVLICTTDIPEALSETARGILGQSAVCHVAPYRVILRRTP